jgi:hypothetical protein
MFIKAIIIFKMIDCNDYAYYKDAIGSSNYFISTFIETNHFKFFPFNNNLIIISINKLFYNHFSNT